MPIKSPQHGLLDMVFASLLFSLMNACVYAVSSLEADIPGPIISFVRVISNLLILLIPAMSKRQLIQLFGDKRPSLWLRGLFGSLALMLSFTAITRIGPGESTFLAASSGVFVALLSPCVLKQNNNLATWLAIIASFCGVSLLFESEAQNIDLLGRGMALLSGFLSAMAYLMVARAGRSNTPQSVIFYFCLLALLLHPVYFAVYGYKLPLRLETWGLLILIGVFGSAAQFCMTRAYQAAPAAQVSAVGYLAPVLSLAWGILCFQQIPSQNAWLGSMLILMFGVLLPFLRSPSK
jgi:S-adenosylmethionine uptake transporter